jgi:hypothetical protein
VFLVKGCRFLNKKPVVLSTNPETFLEAKPKVLLKKSSNRTFGRQALADGHCWLETAKESYKFHIMVLSRPSPGLSSAVELGYSL